MYQTFPPLNFIKESTLNPSPREKSNKAQQSLLSLNEDSYHFYSI